MMSVKVEVPALLAVAAKARWWPITDFGMAAAAGRYVGPVFQRDGWLIQRTGSSRVVVHELEGMDFASCETLRRRAACGRLNDLVLSIYCVNGARTAYLRSIYGASSQTRPPTPIVKIVTERAVSRGLGRKESARISVTVAAAVAASLALAACAEKNKLVTPDGSNRVAVNTPDSLSRYQDLVARQDAMALEKSDLQRKYDQLNQQVERLKTYILEQQRKSTQGEVAPQCVPAPHGAPAAPMSSPSAPPGGTGAVVVGPDSVMFRVSHDVGHTAFTPTEALADEIVKAALAAKTVVIRGRTDADAADPTEERIALSRALHARAYLVGRGVPAAKIRSWYRAAGDFVADNSNADGRARNRRVEIEARGLDTSALSSTVPAGLRVGRNQ
jgi:outer membrane protein OmpA-like peptidoglycan-associated protein